MANPWLINWLVFDYYWQAMGNEWLMTYILIHMDDIDYSLKIYE